MTEAIHISNNPPLVDAEVIANRHKAAFVLSTAVLNAEAGLPETVASEADLEALTKHAKDAFSVKKTLDGARDQEKRPFDEAAKAVQGLFKPRLDKLDATRNLALARITAHNNRLEEQRRKEAAEAARREREEAQRRAEAAAQMEDLGLADVGETVLQTALDAERLADKMERVSTGSAADLVRTQTASGTVTSATSIAFEIVDGDQLRASFGALGAHFNQAHVEQAIRAYVAHHKKQGRGPTDLAVPGVRFFTTTSARVR